MKSGHEAVRVDRALVSAWRLPALDGAQGKEDRGQILVIAGSREVPGAALLAGEAALRTGAGKLQIGTVADAALPLAIALPEARVFALPAQRALGKRASGDSLPRDISQADAVVVGPGMQESQTTSSLVKYVARHASKSMVVDAAALPVFSSRHHCQATPVLTPHAGEMATLLGVPLQEVQDNAEVLAQQFASQANAVVVLKGAVTHIAAPDGRRWRHDGGGIGLGTSGSGDVLAGLIGGLLARGATCEQAAVRGVFVHGLAGERLASHMGTVGYLAREISARVPGILQSLQHD